MGRCIRERERRGRGEEGRGERCIRERERRGRGRKKGKGEGGRGKMGRQCFI
jgi:hypothetical protein